MTAEEAVVPSSDAEVRLGVGDAGEPDGGEDRWEYDLGVDAVLILLAESCAVAGAGNRDPPVPASVDG
jgi:hypothetical protein